MRLDFSFDHENNDFPKADIRGKHYALNPAQLFI